MKFLGILRASAICLLVSAFHGQFVSCGLFNRILSSKKPSNAKVSEISEVSKESTVKSPPSAPLPQSGLVFENSKWHDSHLASTFLFLEEFCRELRAEKFNEKLSEENYEDLSKKCNDVSSHLYYSSERFYPKYGPGSVDKRKQIDQDFYKHVLKPEKFEVYVEWLVKNIPVVTNSLSKMFNESKELTKAQLKTDTSMGPLKYGFLFIGKKWDSSVHRNLGPITNNLTDILKDLQKRLDDVLKSYPKTSSEASEASEVDAKSDVNPQQDGSVVNEDEIPMETDKF
ncbi:secreted antigen 1 [Babesia divergens]|uniref:Secreted antigen 1 n=1 Tax=Babesia divergens TaxID=32595 RepID=A0AAD9LIB0_BABDI|nr:secreted antigen 1 [Babesia divergens]